VRVRDEVAACPYALEQPGKQAEVTGQADGPPAREATNLTEDGSGKGRTTPE
jgi:hypothetical protein